MSPSNIMIFIRFIKEHWGLSAKIIIHKTLWQHCCVISEDIIFSYLFRSAPVPNGKMAIRDWCRMEKRLFGTGAFHQYFFIRDQIFERDQCRLAIFLWKGPVPNSLFSIQHQCRTVFFPFGTSPDYLYLHLELNCV